MGSYRVALLWTLLAAGLVAACFEPLSWGPWSAWFALLPLLAGLRQRTRVQAGLAGWSFGFAVSLSWCSVLLPIPGLHLYQIALLCAYLGCYPGLWAAMVSGWSPGSRLLPVFATSLWVALDYLKAHAGFLAFPIGTLAQTQVANTWVLQSASLFGENAITAIVLWVNLAVWRVLHGARAAERSWLLLPVALALGFGLVTSVRPRQPGPVRVRVAALHTQFSAFGDDHVDTAARMQQTMELVEGAIPPGVRLAVLPESSFVNLSADPGRLAALQGLAEARRLALVVGVAQAVKFDQQPAAAREPSGGMRAGAWVFAPGRGEPWRYDKVRRLAFAEYLPLATWIDWPRWLVGSPAEVVETTKVEVFRSTRGGPIGIMICWESVFAGHAQALVRQGARILLQLSNEGWFAHTAAGAKHNASLRLRAVETRRPVVASVNAGPAVIVDRYGRVLAESGDAAPMQWLTATVEPSNDISFYSRVGDVFSAACIVVAGILAARGRRRGAWRRTDRCLERCTADPEEHIKIGRYP